MKLWKIMLAALICVLMLSAVAMAEVCPVTGGNHAWSEPEEVKFGKHYSISDSLHACDYVTVQYCVCRATKTSEPYTKTGAHVMEYGDWIDATCTMPQHRIGVCEWCAHEEIQKANETTVKHQWEVKKVVDKADCQNNKKFANVCKVCGKYDSNGVYTDGTKGDHVWKDVSKLGAVDCITGGWKSQECTVKDCGEHRDVKVDARGYHVWDYANTVIVAPTCKEQGYSIVKCIDCGFETKHDYVAKNGCDIKWTAGKKATCKTDGFEGYGECKVCGQLFDYATGNEIKAITILYANQNAHEVMNGQWTEVINSCTNTTNYKWGTCVICNEKVYESIPATEHTYYTAAQLQKGEVPSGKGAIENRATCDEAGKGWVMCKVCDKQAINVTLPALGHQWSAWEYEGKATCTTAMTATRKCERQGYCSNVKQYEAVETIVVAPALGHNWVEKEGSSTATCEKAGVVTKICTNCKGEQNNVVAPALGHKYEEKITTAATCTKDGVKTLTCKTCKGTKTEKIPAAHGATKEVVASNPACGVEGKINVICTVCDAVVGTKSIDALKHEYSWKATAPTPSANGKNEYVCALCGHVAETKVVKYTKMYYNNTMTSFGPMTRELVGGNDWERVTPVDLTVDGVYTYDLIASNKYIVGKVTITVNAGTLTVSYKANGVDVKDEALLIYASKADLATGTAVTAPVGAAINAAETFGADTKVLVSLVLTGDYDAAGKGLVDASAAAGMIANID